MRSFRAGWRNGLQAEGHDAVHTRDLADANRTIDNAVNELSMREQRVVITKDGDFVDLFLLRRQPYQLLLLATGNITYRELDQLFQNNLEAIVSAFETYDFIEPDPDLIDLPLVRSTKRDQPPRIGISSDFDGVGGIIGWNDAGETFNVTLELVRRGHNEDQIEKLWSGNLLRVLEAVQRVARELQK